MREMNQADQKAIVERHKTVQERGQMEATKGDGEPSVGRAFDVQRFTIEDDENGKTRGWRFYSRLMELDPAYCDVIVQRWQEFTGKKAEGWRGAFPVWPRYHFWRVSVIPMGRPGHCLLCYLAELRSPKS